MVVQRNNAPRDARRTAEPTLHYTYFAPDAQGWLYLDRSGPVVDYRICRPDLATYYFQFDGDGIRGLHTHMAGGYGPVRQQSDDGEEATPAGAVASREQQERLERAAAKGWGALLERAQDMVGDNDAEEVVQEAFTRAFAKAARLRPKAKPFSFLLGFVDNVGRETQRRSQFASLDRLRG